MASAAPPPVRPPVPAPIPQTATPAPVAADVMTPAPVAIRTVSLPASSATGPARPPASPAPVAATFAYGGPSFIQVRSEEHTSELQSLMRISYAVSFFKQNKLPYNQTVLSLHTSLH